MKEAAPPTAGLGPSRDGREQAESAGPVDGLQAAVGAELVVQVPHVDPFGARVTSQQIRQLAVDAVEQGGTQKQLLDLGRLAFQHLGEQVLGNCPAAAGELRDKSLGVRAAGQ